MHMMVHLDNNTQAKGQIFVLRFLQMGCNVLMGYDVFNEWGGRRRPRWRLLRKEPAPTLLANPTQ